ncbi:MAG: SDR family oxidoreductase [Thermodesulfobacteriota bacterium]
MGSVAITGAGGYIGQRLIAHLDTQDSCTRILGTDLVEPEVTSEKLTFQRRDIREENLIDFWKDQEVETLVHLAFIVDPIHDERQMYDVNVNGTLNILRICEALDIPHVIVASSGTAYGAWPDNPEPLRENDPIRVFPPIFSYAHHKGLNEQHCAEFIRRHPEVVFNIVRPCVVYGPNTQNYLSRYFAKLPFVPLVNGRNPNLQFVHEDDVAQLFTLLIEKKVPGAFNVAGDGVVSSSEVGAMLGKRAVKVPRWLYYAIIWTIWRLNLKTVEAPPGIVDYTSYPWVVDTTRAKDLLGWKPKYTSKDTLRIMFRTHGYTIVD